MSRCLDHYSLFSDDADREYFLSLLETCLQRTNTRCYAWVLLSNHYHLVIRSSDHELWEIMKPLNMRYAHYHQKKTNRRGPLFMDRFKSIVTQDQNYVQELVRYVHLNPVRAGVCDNLGELENYSWSGHSVLMGKCNRKFQDTATVLGRFGADTESARLEYCRFLSSGLEASTDEDILLSLVRKSNACSESGRKTSCWVIGDHAFVRSALESSEAWRLRISRFEKEGGSLDCIAEKISSVFTIEKKMLHNRHRGGEASFARKAFSYVAARHYRAPVRLIAEYLGVSAGAVSAMINQGSKIVEERKIII
jgi:REP element-mobilizing transposase RayT